MPEKAESGIFKSTENPNLAFSARLHPAVSTITGCRGNNQSSDRGKACTLLPSLGCADHLYPRVMSAVQIRERVREAGRQTGLLTSRFGLVIVGLCNKDGDEPQLVECNSALPQTTRRRR